MVQEEVRKSQDQLNETKRVELGHQWVDEMECSWKRVTWSELAMKNGALTEFLPAEIRIRYPAIFFEFAEMGPFWNTKLLIMCARGTLVHILWSLNLELQQWRYINRQGQGLHTLADVLKRARQKANHTSLNKTKGIQFEKAEETARTSSESNSLLDGSKWQMKVDPRRRLVFPDVIQTRTVLISLFVLRKTRRSSSLSSQCHEKKVEMRLTKEKARSTGSWRKHATFIAGRPSYIHAVVGFRLFPGGKHTLISFFKALWWPGFICKFLASQTYDFNQIFSVGRENIVLQTHIIS